MTGRPRKPVALKLLEGTFRRDRDTINPPKSTAVKLPRAPKHLSKTERDVWKRLARAIDPMRIATPADIFSFEMLVSSVAVLERAQQAIRDAGSLTIEVVGPDGTTRTKPHPEVSIASQYARLVAQQLRQWGLTPVDRERVTSLGDDAAKDPLDEFAAPGRSRS